jgi:hypothetical protein
VPPARCERRDENGESRWPSIEIKIRAVGERKVGQARTGHWPEEQSLRSIIEHFNSV